MRFVQGGPQVPKELVLAQEKGQVIFVCGAGVSRAAGLPLFRGLIERIYQELGETWKHHAAEREAMEKDGRLFGQYDRVLRCLERRLGATHASRDQGMRRRIREAARSALSPEDNADLSHHQSLLALSRDPEARVRLLTTNFDTLFERSWRYKSDTAIESHAGPAMPQPKASGFAGVLHLHGRLADQTLGLSETDLVLTSAEFGDAYLRSGWASRYVYDLARAFTIVLIGYQAEDPPMRYLLEALEADRERFFDLQNIYAFAPNGEDEEVEKALWRAKAVEPILYNVPEDDHAALYDTLAQWKLYADDPSAWRRDRLRVIFEKGPDTLNEAGLNECLELLSHGDASQLLGTLSPSASWLPFLSSKDVFNGEIVHPGHWIRSRIDDPEMIRACTDLREFDQQTSWHIGRAIDDKLTDLTAIRQKAWELLLSAKTSDYSHNQEMRWYRIEERVKRGIVGQAERRLACDVLRPRLKIRKPIPWPDTSSEERRIEALHDLLWLHFESTEHLEASELIHAWPTNTKDNLALLVVLSRALIESLEEAQEAGVLEGWDQASSDVPSIAHHDQNAHASGFYPITRVIADLWHRIHQDKINEARRVAFGWFDSQFVLARRLALFALAHDIFKPDEVAEAITSIDDRTFWLSGAQVEIMKLLVYCWPKFDPGDRSKIEARLSKGLPRDLFPTDAFDDEEKWVAICDSSIFKRLKRIEAAHGLLELRSQQKLAEIEDRHPQWRPEEGDRDDFLSWSSGIRTGPAGHPERLAKIEDERLVDEAMRIQREQHFEERDVWRLLCSAEPDRALRSLRASADRDEWPTEAWEPFIWAAIDVNEARFQVETSSLLLGMPDEALRRMLGSATGWLMRQRVKLRRAEEEIEIDHLKIWDRFADLAFHEAGQIGADVRGETDLMSHVLGDPGGHLAEVIVDEISSSKPARKSGLGPEFMPRLNRVIDAAGKSGLLGRVYLARDLSFLHFVDPAWVDERLVVRFCWSHSEAWAMWRAFSRGKIPSGPLFNALHADMMKALERDSLSIKERFDLLSMLMVIGLWLQREDAHEYELSFADIKHALEVVPSEVRERASWWLWKTMHGEECEPPERAQRWRTLIGPLFQKIWPLGKDLRSSKVSQNLVDMAMECDAAFPEAVEAIVDVVVPYRLHTASLSWLSRKAGDENLLRHPLAFLQLLNAVVDHEAHPLPDDLDKILRKCVEADASVQSDAAYDRLYGLRRLRGA